MKGYAVLMMNYIHENRGETAKHFSYQWLVETMNVLSLPAMLVSGTSAIVWRRDVPRHLLRKEDQTKPWCDDDWAFIVVTRTDREERDERHLETSRPYQGKASPSIEEPPECQLKDMGMGSG